jgi:hypothetical protein
MTDATALRRELELAGLALSPAGEALLRTMREAHTGDSWMWDDQPTEEMD